MSQILSIEGKVIEILEEKGKVIATISYSPGFITVPIKTALEIRLNDLLKIDGKFRVENISFNFNEESINRY